MSTLKELRSLGGIVDPKPVQKDITFRIGEDDVTASVYIKRLGVGEYEAIRESREDSKSLTALIIATAVTLGDEGKEKIPYDVAFNMAPSLANALVLKFHEVNNPKKS